MSIRKLALLAVVVICALGAGVAPAAATVGSKARRCVWGLDELESGLYGR